jgi:hypothetical protein
MRQAKLIRNWQPWRQSTGAKTTEGKARSSQNAYKHGLSKLQKELSRLLREHKKAIEGIG